MELRAGYKQTEVGVIPEDWEVIKLKDGIKLFSGHHILAQYCNVEGKGIPYLTGPSDFPEGKIKHSKFTEYPSTICKQNDILVTVKGSGAGTFVIADSEYCISRQLMAIRSTFWDVSYVFSLLKQEESIFSAAATGLIPGLSRVDILDKIIPLPPTKAEQTAIATALSDADALISSLEKLIAKKRNIKQGAMQRLLEPKEGWEVKRLGDCLLKNPDYGINAAAVEFDDTLPTYLRITDISEDGKYLADNKVSVNNLLSESYYLEEGDIVFARTGASVGKTYLYNQNDGRLVFAGFLIRVKANPEILNSNYLFYLTQTKSYWAWVLSNSMRSGQPGLNSQEYKSFQISVPSLIEQTRIVTILSDMDAEITALETKLEKYRKIKLGMMQNLLTGKIRLI